MNEHLIALLDELYTCGLAYIELSNDSVIEAEFNPEDGCIKFRVAEDSESSYSDCGLSEVENLLSIHHVREIR